MRFARLFPTTAEYRGALCHLAFLALAVVLTSTVVLTSNGQAQQAVRAAEVDDSSLVSLINRQETDWRYCDDVAKFAVDASPAWKDLGFDDEAWPVGHGLMGYGDTDIDTKLCFGDDPQCKSVTALFRAQFTLAEISGGEPRFVGGRICCDDGGMVWINGQEVLRHNLPAGKVDVLTFAVEPIGPEQADERAWHPFLVPNSALQSGENLIAVSVHQATSTSSDLAMNVELYEIVDEQQQAEFRQELERAASVVQSSVKVQIGPDARLRYVAE